MLWGMVVVGDRLPSLGVLDDRRWWMDDGNRAMDGEGSRAFGVRREGCFGWKSCSTFDDWAGWMSGIRAC
jgi:hypothetical protein